MVKIVIFQILGNIFYFCYIKKKKINIFYRRAQEFFNEAVEKQPEINGAESADNRSWFAGIPDFVKFQIGHHTRPPPKSGEEENRRDAGENKRPP